VITFESATDVVVVGTGVAGLTAARDLVAAGLDVLVVTKSDLDDASTSWAQGGVAVVLEEAGATAGAAAGADSGAGAAAGADSGAGTDSVAAHVADTLAAAAGLADPTAVATILGEGPGAVTRLRLAGARFDAGPDGAPLRTREGGHHADRIIHAGGDATGAEVERALLAAPDLPAVLDHHLLVDVLLDDTGAAAGVLVLRPDGGLGAIRCGAVVLATGGSGQLFTATTNPAVATGDGLAAALRAGAAVADVEFVQFHPTMLFTGAGGGAGAGAGASGQRPLVTEAVRGAGAVLIDGTGRRIMPGVHPLGDLAPRDVVSRAITERLAELAARDEVASAAGEADPGVPLDHVFLDARAIPAEVFARRFPTVTAACEAVGVIPWRDPIPVAPCAHYQCGGVLTDIDGRTSVPGLYAVGEVARTGLHGANRLASNSLLEGMVMGRRVSAAVEADLVGAYLYRGHHRDRRIGGSLAPQVVPVSPELRPRVQQAMSRHAGIGRNAPGMAGTLATLAALAAAPVRPVDVPGVHREPAGIVPLTRDAVETANLLLVARAVLTAALARTESRGCHVRTDHPAQDPAQARSSAVTLRDGALAVAPLPAGWRPTWADVRLAVAV
jgi:L-aspartate oxidase